MLFYKELTRERSRFLTEKGIQQYLGLIQNNIYDLRHQKYIQEPRREAKLFYQVRSNSTHLELMCGCMEYFDSIQYIL